MITLWGERIVPQLNAWATQHPSVQYLAISDLDVAPRTGNGHRHRIMKLTVARTKSLFPSWLLTKAKIEPLKKRKAITADSLAAYINYITGKGLEWTENGNSPMERKAPVPSKSSEILQLIQSGERRSTLINKFMRHTNQQKYVCYSQSIILHGLCGT